MLEVRVHLPATLNFSCTTKRTFMLYMWILIMVMLATTYQNRMVVHFQHLIVIMTELLETAPNIITVPGGTAYMETSKLFYYHKIAYFIIHLFLFANLILCVEREPQNTDTVVLVFTACFC